MSKAKAPVLTGYLGQLQRAGFGGAAVRLVLEWGGQQRFIPSDPAPACALADIVGLAAARKLAEIVKADPPGSKSGRGGHYIDIPSRKALEDTDKGEILRHQGGTRETAAAIGCTETYVRRVRRTCAGPDGVKRKVSNEERPAPLLDFMRREV